MIRIAFISSSETWHWRRQFPDSAPIWNETQFIFSDNPGECDAVVVYDALPAHLSGKLTAMRSLFVASEPRSIKAYDPDFLAQFDYVVTTDAETSHKGRILGQPGLPWHIGAFSPAGELLENPMCYNDFATFEPIKTRSISVVSSNKAYTPGHRARLEFVAKLKKYFGDEIDVFGRNINGFGDKIEVLSPYRYHIAIENSCYPHYWTEKLSDSYLALSSPIYYGCKNITDYFPECSLTCIDIQDVDTSIASIRTLLDKPVEASDLDNLRKARGLVLDEHNLFNLLTRYMEELCRFPERPHQLIAERPARRESKGFGDSIRRKLTKLQSWLQP